MTKKGYLKWCFIITIICYFAVAFMAGELDSSCWQPDTRVGLVFVIVFACGLTALKNFSGPCDYHKPPH